VTRPDSAALLQQISGTPAELAIHLTERGARARHWYRWRIPKRHCQVPFSPRCATAYGCLRHCWPATKPIRQRYRHFVTPDPVGPPTVGARPVVYSQATIPWRRRPLRPITPAALSDGCAGVP